MATAGVYWCLVLAELIVRLSSAAVLNQTSPLYSPVCPGDKLEFTCISNEFALWRLFDIQDILVDKFGTNVTVNLC